MLQSSIRRGEMDREVTFIKKVLGSNSVNEDKIVGWVEVDEDPTVSAKWVDLRGENIVAAERVTYVQNSKATVDYRSDITTQNRLVKDGRVYEIVGVLENNSGRERYLDIMCYLLDNEVWT